MNNIRASDPDGSKWTAGLQLRDHGTVPKMVKAAGGRIWSPNFNDVDEAKIREAHDLGLKVVVWTVNEPARGSWWWNLERIKGVRLVHSHSSRCE